PQLAAYRLALEATGYEVTGAALVLLGKEPPKKDNGMPVLAPAGAALALSPDPETGEDWARTLLVRAARAASAGELAARTGEHCRTCPVKDSCPVQSEGRRTVS
ncbi:PD-(D/E)XK nuclease family protein, partial [Actinomyces sp. 217892]